MNLLPIPISMYTTTYSPQGFSHLGRGGKEVDSRFKITICSVKCSREYSSPRPLLLRPWQAYGQIPERHLVDASSDQSDISSHNWISGGKLTSNIPSIVISHISHLISFSFSNLFSFIEPHLCSDSGEWCDFPPYFGSFIHPIYFSHLSTSHQYKSHTKVNYWFSFTSAADPISTFQKICSRLGAAFIKRPILIVICRFIVSSLSQ
jgi:hypothetical protein